MLLEPGFAGQKFMPGVLEKVRELREDRGFVGDLEMDGGVGPTTVEACAQAGANVMVAGSAVFKSDDPAAAVRMLREKAEKARGI